MTSLQQQTRRDEKLFTFLLDTYGDPSSKYSVKYCRTISMNNTVHPVIFENSTGRCIPLTHNKNGRRSRVIRANDLHLDQKNLESGRPSYLKLDFSDSPIIPLNAHQKHIPLPKQFDAVFDDAFSRL